MSGMDWGLLILDGFLVLAIVVIVWLKKDLWRSDKVVGSVIIFIAIVLLATGASQIFGRVAYAKSNEWLNTLAPGITSLTTDTRKKALEEDSVARTLASLKADDAAALRFRQQFASVERVIAMQSAVMGMFYRANYLCVSMGTLFGVLAGAVLIYSSIEGLKVADLRLRTMFLTLAVIASVYTVSAQVYQQAKNVADSKVLFQTGLALRDRMLTYAAIGRTVNGDTMSITRMIPAIDNELSKITIIPIGFDDAKIPQSGLESLKSRTP